MVLYLLALLAGALQALQTAINAQLGKQIGNPVLSACVSGLLGGFLIAAYLLFSKNILPKGAAATLQIPWWMWTGGVLGAAYLTSLVLATPKLGTGTVMALAIAVQVTVAVALDHFALLGLEPHPASWPRILGVLCFVVGAFLIQHF